MDNKYKDIMNIPYIKSTKRPQMPIADRAAQFSPFAALTGFEDVIIETGRSVDSFIELDELEKNEINEKLIFIKNNIDKRCKVVIRYFKEDALKEGGSYLLLEGIVEKIDENDGMIIFDNKIKIKFEHIISIDGDLFDGKSIYSN